MSAKLSKFNQNNKIPYTEVLKKLNEIEQLYIQILGPRETWSEYACQTIEEMRMYVISENIKEVDTIEQQYESRCSLNNLD